MHLASKSIHTLIYWRFVTSCNLYVQPPHSHTLFKNEWICALYCNYPIYKLRYLLWKFNFSHTYHELHIITPFLIQFSSLCLSLCLGFVWLPKAWILLYMYLFRYDFQVRVVQEFGEKGERMGGSGWIQKPAVSRDHAKPKWVNVDCSLQS